MKHQARFELEDFGNVRATLTISATINEWRAFVQQAEGQKMGNMAVVTFHSAITGMLREAEQRFADSSNDVKETAATMDAILRRAAS